MLAKSQQDLCGLREDVSPDINVTDDLWDTENGYEPRQKTDVEVPKSQPVIQAGRQAGVQSKTRAEGEAETQTGGQAARHVQRLHDHTSGVKSLKSTYNISDKSNGADYFLSPAKPATTNVSVSAGYCLTAFQKLLVDSQSEAKKDHNGNTASLMAPMFKLPSTSTGNTIGTADRCGSRNHQPHVLNLFPLMQHQWSVAARQTALLNSISAGFPLGLLSQPANSFPFPSLEIPSLPADHSILGSTFSQPRMSALSSLRRPGNPFKSPPVKKYRCEECGKSFSRSNTLVTHKRIHTGEKPFKCDSCGRAFRQPGNLTRHKLTHTTIKPYVCPTCGKAFNRASNLHTHLRTHADLKPSICHFCGKSFSQKIDLKVHFYNHTGLLPMHAASLLTTANL